MDTYEACHFSILIAVKFPYYSHKESVNIWIYYESDTTHTRPVSRLTINENRLEAERYTFFFIFILSFSCCFHRIKYTKPKCIDSSTSFPRRKIAQSQLGALRISWGHPWPLFGVASAFLSSELPHRIVSLWSLSIFGSIEILYFGRIYCCVIVIAMRMEAHWKNVIEMGKKK